MRRAFLCGQDACSGQGFDYRKAWVQERLETLAGSFGVDVTGFAMISNQLHVILGA